MNKALEEILKLADSQIGYKEEYINCTKYSRYFDVEAWQWFNTKKNGNPAKKVAGTKWCAIFICWLFTQVLGNKPALVFLGCPAPKNNCAAGCGYLYDYMKAKGYKSTIRNVKPGDIVFFKGKKGKCEHVGICFDVDGNNIHTIEGNKGDQVKKCHHYKNSDIYFGVMSPDWSKAHWIGEKEDPAPAPLPAKPETPAAPTEELKTGEILIVSIKYNSSYLSLRAYASTSAPTLKKMKKGTKVTYLGERSGSWLKVSCGNLIGWACQHEASKDYDYLTKA